MSKAILLCALFFHVGFNYAQHTVQKNESVAFQVSARINHYDTSRFNYLDEKTSLLLSEKQEMLSIRNSFWQVQKEIKPSKKEGVYELSVSFKCVSGSLTNASLSVDLSFSSWSKDNYLLLPAAAYNGNRYPTIQMDYSPFFTSQSQMGLNKPLMLADNPRLNYKEGFSRLQEISGSLAVPAAGFKSALSSQGFWILFQQGNDLGDYGIDVEENSDRSRALFTLTSPMMREVQRHWLTRMDVKPSTDKPANFHQGDSVVVKCLIDVFNCPTIQALYDELAVLRSAYFSTPMNKPKLMPLSEAYRVIEKRQNEENWRKEGYYATSIGNGWGADWQPGWVGGLIQVYALYAEGNEQSKKNSIKNLDWLYPQGIAPSGYYYDLRHEGKFVASKDPKPFGKNLGLTRKNADAVYYALRQFSLLRQLGEPVKDVWQEGNKRALLAQLNTWKKYGQLGQWVNQETGELGVGNTTSAAIFSAALCEAYKFYNEKAYLSYAEEIGEYYYKNFVAKGIICGGPGDALQSFDSESAYGLLESYIQLYEETANKRWLRYAEETAAQFASWVMAYDYTFPANTTFGKLDMRTTGLVWANTQNKTAVPSICTHSGIALLKLYRATQNPFYISLLSDITHSIAQFMSWKEHPIPGYHDGWIFERGGTSDWLEGVGETSAHPSFPGTSLMLAYAELPGVYVNTDTKQVFVFDHVNAFINKKGQLEIINPTPYEAIVKVLVEDRKQASQALKQNLLVQYKKIKLRPGARALLQMSKGRA